MYVCDLQEEQGKRGQGGCDRRKAVKEGGVCVCVYEHTNAGR